MGNYKEKFIEAIILLIMIGLIIGFMTGFILLLLGVYKFLLIVIFMP